MDEDEKVQSLKFILIGVLDRRSRRLISRYIPGCDNDEVGICEDQLAKDFQSYTREFGAEQIHRVIECLIAEKELAFVRRQALLYLSLVAVAGSRFSADGNKLHALMTVRACNMATWILHAVSVPDVSREADEAAALCQRIRNVAVRDLDSQLKRLSELTQIIESKFLAQKSRMPPAKDIIQVAAPDVIVHNHIPEPYHEPLDTPKHDEPLDKNDLFKLLKSENACGLPASADALALALNRANVQADVPGAKGRRNASKWRPSRVREWLSKSK